MIIDLKNSIEDNNLSDAQKKCTTILALEGKDDCVFVEHFYFSQTFPAGLVLVNLGGIDNFNGLESFISASVKTQAMNPLFYKLAVIVDADESFDGRRKQLQKFLGIDDLSPTQFGMVPAHKLGQGDNALYAGYFILPDNANEGGLESLALAACCQQPYQEWATGLIDTSQRHRALSPSHSPYKLYEKRIMQAYLATQQNEPPKKPYLCNGVGYAIKNEILTIHDAAPLNGLHEFLDAFMALPKEEPRHG